MTGKSKDYFSGRADAVDDVVRLLNNHAAMFTSQTSCVIAALAKQVETLKEGDDMALYRWLEQAAKSDYKEVYEAARTMMAYYQGAEFQTKDQASPAAQSGAVDQFEKWLKDEERKNGCIGLSSLERDQMKMAFCAAVELSRAQTAPADGLMVDMVPPATSRDRWMYEQGRLAERDPRTHVPAPVSEQPAFPERDPSKPAEQQGMFRKFDVRRVDGSDQPGGKHHGCRYFVLDLDHDPAAPAGMRGYAAEIRATHPKLADDIEAEFGEQPAAQTFCASCHTVVRCAESGECDHHGYKLQIAEGGGNE